MRPYVRLGSISCGFVRNWLTGSALVGMIIGYLGEVMIGGFTWVSRFKGTAVWFFVTLIVEGIIETPMPPIFNYCDYGIVGDMDEVCDAMIARLKV